jgi:hypothetical protein
MLYWMYIYYNSKLIAFNLAPVQGYGEVRV